MARPYHGGRPYSPNPVPFEAEDLPRFLQNEFTRLAEILADLGKIAWGGTYELGECYDKGTQVTDEGWTMIANKDTCDRPAPQPIGVPAWVLPEVPVWNSKEATAATLQTGQQYTFPVFGFITGLRVWLPIASSNTYYRVYITVDPDGPSPRTSILADWFTTTTTGWNYLAAGQKPMVADVPFALVVQTQNRTGQQQFAANYVYTTPGNTTPPINGTITHDNQNKDTILISTTDNDGNNMSLNLALLALGDEISGAGMSWQVQTNVDNGTYHTYTVIPAQQGAPTGEHPFNFTHYADQPVPYVEITDEWLNNPNIQGYYQAIVNAPVVHILNNNGYGTDIEWQEAETSDDWDFVSAP